MVSTSLPLSPQHKPRVPLLSHTDPLLRSNICSHSTPTSPSPPSAGYRWSSQALTWATTNLFMVHYRTEGVLIQTTETTMTHQPTMEGDGGGRGMPKDAQDPSPAPETNIIADKYGCFIELLIQLLDFKLVQSNIVRNSRKILPSGCISVYIMTQ